MTSQSEIHFIGIGGVGMAGVAVLLHARGIRVSGCDLGETPRTRWLASLGIPIAIGHHPDHLGTCRTLVVTPAVPSDNAERAAAQKKAVTDGSSFRIRYRGEVLADLVNEADGIAVCGTHGKTTTATFTTRLLQELGEAPSWCIGGESPALKTVAGQTVRNTSAAAPLVAEADESDGTLALYRPAILVLNAADLDHLEHFASETAYFDCYRTVLRNTRSSVVVCRDHAKAWELARDSADPAHTVSFGTDPEADVRAVDLVLTADRSDFVICLSARFGGGSVSVSIPVAGAHNVRNALAAAAVALLRGHSLTALAQALPQACAALPARRFETLAVSGGVRVVTDYAHHPDELRQAVAMARLASPRRLRVLFQPHRYTRTKALGPAFPSAFAAADELILIPVYPAFEQPIPGGDSADLYRRFRDTFSDGNGPHVLLARSAEEAWRHAFLTAQAGDFILIAGAGDIIALTPRIQADMAAPPVTRTFTPLAPFSFFRTGGVTCGGGRPFILGAGSNTWISDCATDAEAVRAPDEEGDPAKLIFPAAWSGAQLLTFLNARDLHFLDFMDAIPGTIGGWAAMNAGAFGHAFGDHVASLVQNGRNVPHAACGFAYRTCRAASDGLITAVCLTPDDLAAPERGVSAAPLLSRKDYRARRKKFPPRTCGSVFKNPPGDTAGRLLEAAGAKNLTVGGARVWSEHANVIVADAGCTASDILALARLMAASVRENFGIILETEIRGLSV